MNQRRKVFISQYLISGNATESAIRAGYSGKTAYSQGQRMLKNVEVMEEIKESQERLKIDTEIRLKEILSEIKSIAFTSKSESLRLKALDMLMKHLGGYTDNFKILSSLEEEDLEEIAKRIIQRNATH